MTGPCPHLYLRFCCSLIMSHRQSGSIAATTQPAPTGLFLCPCSCWLLRVLEYHFFPRPLSELLFILQNPGQMLPPPRSLCWPSPTEPAYLPLLPPTALPRLIPCHTTAPPPSFMMSHLGTETVPVSSAYHRSQAEGLTCGKGPSECLLKRMHLQYWKLNPQGPPGFLGSPFLDLLFPNGLVPFSLACFHL